MRLEFRLLDESEIARARGLERCDAVDAIAHGDVATRLGSRQRNDVGNREARASPEEDTSGHALYGRASRPEAAIRTSCRR
jgi:hypothetical protein